MSIPRLTQARCYFDGLANRPGMLYPLSRGREFTSSSVSKLVRNLRFQPQAFQASRSYSITPFFSSLPSFATSLTNGKDDYLFLQSSTNSQKTETLIRFTIRSLLSYYKEKDIEGSLEQSWNHFGHVHLTHGLTFPPFNRYNVDENIFNLFSLIGKKLIKGSDLHEQFQYKDFIISPTDCMWSYAIASLPFTRYPEQVEFNQNRISYILEQGKASVPSKFDNLKKWIYFTSQEDALGALLLATPYLDEDTFLHEVGCWSGENLINLLYHVHVSEKSIAGCIGTDVNSVALNLAQAAANFIGLPEKSVQFHLGNALQPPRLNALGFSFRKQVTVALRVVPLLEPQQAKKFILATRETFKDKNSVLVLSYATLTGKMFEMNKAKAEKSSKTGFRQEVFDNGVMFKAPFPNPKVLFPFLKEQGDIEVVTNTYYSPAGFEKLARECGFKITNSIAVGKHSDNDRLVVLLTPLS